jgi:hypothetical protein
MASSTYSFGCPHCRETITGSPSHAGTSIVCPGCGKAFTVPPLPRPVSSGSNPLVIPLVIVSVLFLAAIGAGAFLWMNHSFDGASATAAASTSNPGAPTKSAEPNDFDEVAGHLDRGGSFYLYANTAQWLAGLSKQIGDFQDLIMSSVPKQQNDADRQSANLAFKVLTDLVKKSGVEEVSGVGASSIAVEKGIYLNKLFVRHESGAGEGFMWSAFGRSSHPLEALDLLPADTVLASFSDLNLGNVLDGLRQEIEQSANRDARKSFDASLAQFSTSFGISAEDVLSSLDGSIGWVLTLDPAKTVSIPRESGPLVIPTPRAALFLRVKDDRIFKQIEHSMGANPNIRRHDLADVRMLTLPVPGPNEAWLRPTVAQWTQGYLLVASDSSIIDDMIAAQKTGKGLKSTPQFASLMAGLPTEGNSFQIVTEQFGKTLGPLRSEMFKNQPGTTPEQTALMQKFFAGQTPGTSCTISTHLADGWMVIGKGTQGARQMLGSMAIPAVAIAAAVALPVFSQVEQKGKATKSLSNAKQLATGCKLYAIDNKGKFPPTLQTLVPDYIPNMAIFASPFQTGVPVGYDYTPGLTDTSSPSLVLIEDKFAPQVGHVRVVCHVDTSAEVIKIPPGTH